MEGESKPRVAKKIDLCFSTPSATAGSPTSTQCDCEFEDVAVPSDHDAGLCSSNRTSVQAKLPRRPRLVSPKPAYMAPAQRSSSDWLSGLWINFWAPKRDGSTPMADTGRSFVHDGCPEPFDSLWLAGVLIKLLSYRFG